MQKRTWCSMLSTTLATSLMKIALILNADSMVRRRERPCNSFRPMENIPFKAAATKDVPRNSGTASRATARNHFCTRRASIRTCRMTTHSNEADFLVAGVRLKISTSLIRAFQSGKRGHKVSRFAPTPV